MQIKISDFNLFNRAPSLEAATQYQTTVIIINTIRGITDQLFENTGTVGESESDQNKCQQDFHHQHPFIDCLKMMFEEKPDNPSWSHFRPPSSQTRHQPDGKYRRDV